MEIDGRDLKILALLQDDCRIPNAELAQRVGMSASACWRRVRALEEAGVIEKYSAQISPAGIGFDFHAIVHVHLTRHDPDRLGEFIRAVENCPDVQECYATTGQADYHLKVMCRDLEAYNHFLEKFLFRLPAVASAQTNLVLRTIKNDPSLAR
ncbi:Lrp/AsnC family transcriptional regulator [Thalassococcus sp. S3]|uniref:Lrp/AsnC family transcriptional regulator n=1 Tax=Thalassococcus sp. S3 TaxID=2017482 RepID=UPI0010241F6A|nr:Lrp/AsnC family transcriptional regulator [Thalassococcus sp. S3]QBF30697.1 AsnC family transcriptional regulator [Thalassococcus sp. S3]